MTPEMITFAPLAKPPYESFDQRLRKIMRIRGLCAAHLERRSRVDATAISKLCAGKSKPTFWTLVELASALNVSIDWLVGLTDEMRPLKLED